MSPSTFWSRYWFVIAMGIAVPVGIYFPEPGIELREARFILPVLVGVTLFISGLTLDTGHLSGQVKNVRAILGTLATTYAVAPALAFGVSVALVSACGQNLEGAESFGFRFLEAMMITACQSGTLASSVILTSLSRGDQELALVLTVFSNLLTAVLTPLLLWLSIGAEVELPVGAMVLRMVLVVLLPVCLGQIARRLIWQRVRPMARVIRRVPQGIILTFVYTGVSGAAARLSGEVGPVVEFLAACIVLHALLLGWSYLLGLLLALKPRARVAVFFCGAQKTLPNGIYLWDRFFAANPYGAIPLALYHIVQLVADTLLVPLMERVATRGREATGEAEKRR